MSEFKWELASGQHSYTSKVTTFYNLQLTWKTNKNSIVLILLKLLNKMLYHESDSSSFFSWLYYYCIFFFCK